MAARLVSLQMKTRKGQPTKNMGQVHIFRERGETGHEAVQKYKCKSGLHDQKQLRKTPKTTKYPIISVYVSSEKSQATENDCCKNELYNLPYHRIINGQTDKHTHTHTHTHTQFSFSHLCRTVLKSFHFNILHKLQANI